MKKILLVCLFSSSFSGIVFSQNIDIGFFFGRFYALYKFVDYGTGFKNLSGTQYNSYPSIAINKRFSKRNSAEIFISYLAYPQYTGTRLYTPGFTSTMHGVNFSFTVNYSFISSSRLDCRIKGGLGIGLIPDMYEGTFIEMFTYPFVDSISRGTIRRDFTPLFPTLSTGLDVSYKISSRFKGSFLLSFQKGFLKITEYNINYNNGNGNNDQKARQWGTGDFYGLQLGLRYSLRSSN